MRIKFDPAKDAANIKKHEGLSLADAEKADWNEAIVFPDNRFAYDEARLCALVPIGDRLCHITFTEMKEDSIRVISIRHAEKNEVLFYVQNYR
jgi:uncharacterized DUF497 family protein